jgi:RimJ/RimL family protein N-acetyltransferase
MMDEKGSYRRNGKNIYIKQPDYKDLAFVTKLWADEETMKDIGGAFKIPENKWDMFYKKMVYPTDGKNFYCLVYTIRDKAVGEVSFHGYDLVTKIARFNIKIHYRYRNKGYGEEALRLLFEYYFLEFGGQMMMDKIPTLAGVEVAKKLGFKEVGKYKDGLHMKITKEEFLNNKGDISQDIGILMFDGMSMIDYATFHDMLAMVNNIEGKNIFNIYSISFKDEVTLSNGVVIKTKKFDLDKCNPHVLIIPGGNSIEENVKDKEIIKFIMMKFNNCDYICTQGEAIKFLIRCRSLEGILIPRFEGAVEQGIEEEKIVKKNFVDNGKILISVNALGELEMILSLVEKIAGRTLAEKLQKQLGITIKTFIKDN